MVLRISGALPRNQNATNLAPGRARRARGHFCRPGGKCAGKPEPPSEATETSRRARGKRRKGGGRRRRRQIPPHFALVLEMFLIVSRGCEGAERPGAPGAPGAERGAHARESVRGKPEPPRERQTRAAERAANPSRSASRLRRARERGANANRRARGKREPASEGKTRTRTRACAPLSQISEPYVLL